MPKCKTVRKKNVRNNILSFLAEDDSVCDTIQKSFYTPEIHKDPSDRMAAMDILLWSKYSELHHSWSHVSRVDFNHEILLVTQKFFNIAKKRRHIYCDHFISSETKLRI